MDATRFRCLEMGRVSPILLWCGGVLNMETLSSRHLFFATQKTFPSRRKPLNFVSSRSIRFPNPKFRFRVHAKASYLQDFQGYAKPSRLIQATEVEVCTETSIEKLLSSLEGDESQSLFKVDICTSKLFGSNLSDLNAGILLCLIDEKGNSILQRIPASFMTDHSIEKDTLDDSEILRFQRGSFDEFVFKGPKLYKLKAIWLSVESGQWRVGSLSLTVISWFQPSIEKTNGEELQFVGLKFDFPTQDILLGEGSDNSMVELRPCLVSELSGVEPISFLGESSSHPNLATIDSISNEQSMKEYAAFKFSLLIYDAMLIFAGTSIASFLAGENAAPAFFTGGILGFLYLLLLQRSVDKLPAPSTISETTRNEDRPFGQYKGPLSTLALAIGFAIFAVKFNLGDSPIMLTPKEVVIGMLGFLACKVAVVLAAMKPMTLGQKVNE